MYSLSYLTSMLGGDSNNGLKLRKYDLQLSKMIFIRHLVKGGIAVLLQVYC